MLPLVTWDRGCSRQISLLPLQHLVIPCKPYVSDLSVSLQAGQPLVVLVDDDLDCYLLDEEDEDTGPDKNELQNQLRTLGSKLEDLNTCNDLIIKHGAALQRSLSELEQLEAPTDAANQIKAVNERATLFRITSNAMINVSIVTLNASQQISVA